MCYQLSDIGLEMMENFFKILQKMTDTLYQNYHALAEDIVLQRRGTLAAGGEEEQKKFEKDQKNHSLTCFCFMICSSFWHFAANDSISASKASLRFWSKSGK